MKLLTFNEALTASDEKRHVLLGNGFSIACRPDIFQYGKLFEQADFSKLSATAKKSFDALKTTDFEVVIRTLNNAAALADAYTGFDKVAEQMRKDASKLKDLLVETIAKSHPDIPGNITNAEYEACEKFLSNFRTIYTLNYDLLLYWTKMHEESETKVASDDGFRTSQSDIEEGMESDYVVWEPGQSHSQNAWFLHGALHIFDSGLEIQKYTWKRTGVRLTRQIRKALENNLFPVFVAEGTSDEKLTRIRHNDYLAKAYRSFQSIGNSLFIHGHSLAENDEHFLKLIERGKLTNLYIGLHGKPDSNSNKGIIKRAERMATNRKRGKLDIDFYDSDTAKVWGK